MTTNSNISGETIARAIREDAGYEAVLISEEEDMDSDD
jgi:hypothetical protein